MKRLIAVLAVMATMSLAGSLLAMTLEPSPALPGAQPVILGEVSGVSNHTVSVTAPGEDPMTFEFDSRSMMPARLENGERVKVEYRILDTGLHLAQRVTPLTHGSRDWEELDRQLSMVPVEDETRSGMLVAATAPDNQESPEQHEAISETHDEAAPADQSEQAEGTNTSTASNEEQTMPSTASVLPWLLVSSGMAMFLALGLWLLRRIAVGREA
jgi:hypothetical protein